MKEIVIKLDGGIGAFLPNDPVNGRFHVRGTVVEGTKPMLGRKVRVDMTKGQLDTLVNMGSAVLLRHPQCGTRPQEEEA